jgi:predicted nucleic acid-binding protein
MKYVLDSCVAIKWVLPEAETPTAVRILNEFRRGLHELLAPDVFPVEVGHALAKAERKGTIRPPIGTRRLLNVMRNVPDLHPYLPLLPRAFAIASAARMGVYDCLYVALAEREGCDVLTTDVRMKNSLPGGPVVLLSSLP